MKRVILWYILFLSVQFATFFCLGKYVFYKETIVSFPGQEVYAVKSESNNKIYNHLEVTTKSGNTHYDVSVTDKQARMMITKGYFKGYWYKMHLWLHIFYIASIIGVIIYDLFSLTSLSNLHYDGNEFHKCWDCNSNTCKIRCKLYNRINEYNSEPLKKNFKEFWGYKTVEQKDVNKENTIQP